MKPIVVTIKDCQPNDRKPGLDLYFPKQVAHRHGWRHKQTVDILFDDGPPWRGTVGMKYPNPPYLHRTLTRPGERISMRDWLLDHGCKDGARVELIEEGPTRFRWKQIVDAGQWSSGRAPGERRPATNTTSHLREVIKQKPASSRVFSSNFPFEDAHAVLQLANVDYWQMIKSREQEAEHRFEQEMPSYRKLDYLDKRIFLEIARWKSVRPSHLYDQNSEDEIQSRTAEAFNAKDDVTAVSALCSLSGIGLRTAVALLHWMRPDRFPMIDIRVVDALGITLPANWEDIHFYSSLADRIRQHADILGVDLRTMDRALWVWDKQQKR